MSILTEEEKKNIQEMSEGETKIGVIYISYSLTHDREWLMALPKSISFHAARISFPGCSSTECAINEAVNSGQLDTAAEKLGSAEVDVIAFGCTAGTFLRGITFDRELADRISKAAGGIPTVTTSGGVLKALNAMGCKKVNAQTPYVPELNIKERQFLEENGIEVLNLEGFDVEPDQDIARVRPEQFAEKIMEFDEKNPEADACFISCTNSRSIEAINFLEKKLHKPVISSNSSALYAALTEIGYKKGFTGYGVLFEKYL